MSWCLVIILCAVHLVSSYEGEANSRDGVIRPPIAGYMLPRDVTPRHYDVRLLYDLDPATNFSAYGVVDITFIALKPTSKIVLHMQGLTLDEDKITLIGENDAPSINTMSLNEAYSLLTFELEQALKTKKNYTLTIPFRTNLKPGLDGVYISTYVDSKTQNKEYLAATQFEAITARKAFPCFDEPLYKATFRITLGHHKSYTAVSNMPLEKASDVNALEKYWPWSVVGQTFKKEQSNFVWDRFENSVPMSTYLVAFVISKFSYVESPSHLSKTKFKIWARSDAVDQTSYAATVGPKTLTYYEKWFNVSFPLPKLDMFAIPDFAAGAMENWGLVTYRETMLLFDKKQSSYWNKEGVAEVVAHELAHQWFGNLVTMKWWSDLWLNEGFATFAAAVAINAMHPSWDVENINTVEDIQSVFDLDALESSHPVSVPIDDPKRIPEIFDAISYSKGSTLIRMMTKFLGENVFREGIHNYLVKYSYSNAEQDDLWSELTAVSHKHNVLTRNVTVKQIMDTWTKQTGYPILDVDRDYGSKSLTITQKRYLALGSKATTSTSWWIPLRVLCENEPAPYRDAPLQWLADDEGVDSRHQFTHGAGSDEWVLFNTNMIAPYRVNYDERNWRLLTDTLTGGKLSSVPVLGRVQLLADAFELAWTNRLNYTITLQLASYLQNEEEYVPLGTGLDALSTIGNVLKRSAEYGTFQKYVRKLIGAKFAASGFTTKKIINQHNLKSVKMQVLMSGWACRMQVPGCEENAIELFQKWMDEENPDENNPIPINLRFTVYCVGVSRGSVREWRFVLARRQRSNVAAARVMLLLALTCTREVWILNELLEWTVTEGSEVRRQDANTVMAGVLSSTVGYYVGKEFVYSRIKDIYNAFNNQGQPIDSIINSLLGQFTKQQELDEFLAWRARNEQYLSGSTLSVAQGIENARVNIDWVARNKQSVVEQMREQAT